MKKEELASLLNGRGYRNELTNEEEKQALESGLVVVYGQSDDICEFRGAINNELCAPVTSKIEKPGEMALTIINGDTYYKPIEEYSALIPQEGCNLHKPNLVDVEWAPDNLDCSWLITSDIPHSPFDIMEDGELYCRGIVFDIKDLK